MPDVLSLAGVTKHYGDDQPVFSNLSHVFLPGTATGLVGPNGSGKTTLIRLLSLASYPSEGSICYGKEEIGLNPHQYLSNLGLVHDTAQLPEFVTATEWLEFVLRSRNRWTEEGPARIAQVLEHVMLDERRERLIATYSSGMRKKTQIAAALVANPTILLLDEPLRGLDTASHASVIGLLKDFSSKGGIVIISSHMKPSLQAICDAYLELDGRGS